MSGHPPNLPLGVTPQLDSQTKLPKLGDFCLVRLCVRIYLFSGIIRKNNMRTKILYFTFALSFFLFLANSFAIKTNLYWTTPWADIVTHTVGGMIVAGGTILLWEFKNLGRKIKLSSIISSVIIVGLVWELFELYYGLTLVTDPGYFLDTAGDIFFDTFGAYIGYRFLISK